MGKGIPPAVVCKYIAVDEVMKVISTPYDGVSFRRGFGDSGYRVEIVQCDCPVCDFDRMIRRHDVSPEEKDTARYWCLNPNCAHFVRGELSHVCHNSYPQNIVSEPARSE